MPAREFCMIVKESSYGVPKSSPTLGTDSFVLRLTGSNAFSMQQNPNIGKIPYGGGYNTPACRYSAQVTHQGTLTGELYKGAFGKFICDWAFTQINTGRTTPWVTTDANYVMPPTDLASVSIYHAAIMPDGTFKRRRHRGVKVMSGSISASNQNGGLVTYSFQLQGQGDDLNAAGATTLPDATEFPVPAETDYPCGSWLFQDTAGQLKIGDDPKRTLYDSCSINFTNSNAANWFEGKYVNLIKFCGRDVKASIDLYTRSSPDDEAFYRALTSLDAEFAFDDGAEWLKFDFGANNAWDALVNNRPIDNVYKWTGTLQNYWDSATGTDLTITSGTHED
jgi:hypothetical protein